MAKRIGTAKWYDKEQRWRIYVMRDGVRKVFSSGTPGRAGQRECNAKADAWLDEYIEDGNIRVDKAFEMYIADLKLTTSKDHYRQYEGYGRNHILPLIGNKKVIKLTEQHLQDVINKAYAADEPLSKKTLQNLRACLTQFIKYCRKNKLTTLFPESLTIPRGAAPPNKPILQPEELKRLFVCDRTIIRAEETTEPYVNAWRFEVVTGLRPGEVIGLKESDIIKDVVHIQRSIDRRGHTTTGKNDNARRSFKLHALSKAIIDAQRNYKELEGIDSEYVFCNEYGDFIPQSTYYKRWIRYRDYNKIAANISPYELRHTFVSIVKSLPPGIIKQMVGHSANMDTFGVYSHEVTGDMDIAAELTEDVLLKVLGDNFGDVSF